MKKKRKIIIIVIIIIVLLAGGFFGYQKYQESQRAARAASVQTNKIVRGDLMTTISATGSLRAKQTSYVTWETSGTVQSVLVRLDDKVEKGQKLAELDSTSLPQSVIVEQASLVTYQRELEDLLNSDLARSQAYQTMVAAENTLKTAREDRLNLNYTHGTQKAIDAAKVNVLLAEAKLKQAQEDYDKVAHLQEDDLARANAAANLSAAKQELDKMRYQYNYVAGHADELEIAEADAAVQVAEAKLADAKREWERLKDGPDAADIEAAKAKVSSSEAALKLGYLEAPYSGTITEVSTAVGDQIIVSNQQSMGATAFRIDDLSHMYVDVKVTEVDINSVKIGQPASLTFDAVTGKEYNGKVTEVGRVGSSSDGVINFTVTVELTDFDEKLHPGMTAAVNIITNKVENVLYVPSRAIRTQGDKHSVLVMRNGFQVPVEVEVGFENDTSSEIKGGDVKEGDVVVLNPTALVTQSGNMGGPGMMIGGPMGGGPPPGGGGGGGQR